MSFSLIFCCTSGTDTVDLNSLTERRPPVVHEPYRIRYQGWPLVVVFVPHNRRVNSLSTSWNWTVSNRCIVATDMLPLQPYDGHVRWPKIIFTSKSKSFIIQSEIGITIKRALATRFAFTHVISMLRPLSNIIFGRQQRKTLVLFSSSSLLCWTTCVRCKSVVFILTWRGMQGMKGKVHVFHLEAHLSL